MAEARRPGAEGARRTEGTDASGHGEVVVAVPRLPTSLAPWRTLDRLADHVARDLVFTGLLRRDPTHAPWAVPALADRCVGLGRLAARGSESAAADPAPSSARTTPAAGDASAAGAPRAAMDDGGSDTAATIGPPAERTEPAAASGTAGTSGGDTGFDRGMPGTAPAPVAPSRPATGGRPAAEAIQAPESSSGGGAAGPGPTDGGPISAVPGPREVYCHVSEAAVFHDGTAVRPEDVVASVEAVLDPRASRLRDDLVLRHLRSVEIVDGPPNRALEAGTWVGPRHAERDGRWVHMRFSVSDPMVFERISAISVLRAADVRRTSHPTVGAGPFRVRSMSPDRLELVPVLRKEGMPSAVVLRAVPDGADRLRLLRRRRVHVVWPVSPTHVPNVLRRTGTASRFRGYLTVLPVYDLAAFRIDRPALSDLRVRRALDQLMPRSRIAEGLASLVVPVRPPSLDAAATELDLAALEAAGPNFHPARYGLPVRPSAAEDEAGQARADALLDQAGFRRDPRGIRRREDEALRLVLLYPRGETSRNIASEVATALEARGIVVARASASFGYLRSGPLADADFDVAVLRLSMVRAKDPTPYFHSDGFSNVFGVKDASLDAALEAFVTARTAADRRRALQRVAARLSEIVPFAVLAVPAEIVLVDRTLAPPRIVDGVLDLRSLSWASSG